MKTYFKQLHSRPAIKSSQFHECHKYCKQDDKVEVVHYDKKTQYCECLKKVKHDHEATDIVQELKKTYMRS